MKEHPSKYLQVIFHFCLLHDASGHSNVLKAGKAEDLKNARKRRTARKANKLRSSSRCDLSQQVVIIV